MSADLFAEFNSPPSGQPQQQQHNQQSQSNSFTTNAAGNDQDPFGFLLQSNSTTSPPSQPSAQQWPSFQSQPSVTGNTGFGGALSPAPEAPDDDDAWGDFETAGESAQQPAQPGSISWPTSAQPSGKAKPAEQDPWENFGQSNAASNHPDPWSVFEKADSSRSKPEPKPLAAFKQPEPGRLVRASTLDIMTNNLVSADRSSKPPSPKKPEPSFEKPVPRPRLKEPTNPNVMFDADDFELEGGDEDDDFDDDEFGEFESVASSKAAPSSATRNPAPAPSVTAAPAPTSQRPPSMDLLSLDDPIPPSAPAPKPTPPSGTQSSKPLGFGATTVKKSQNRPQNAKASSTSQVAKPSKPAVAEDEDWGAWDSFDLKDPKSATKPQSPAPADNWDWEPAEPTPTGKPEAKDDEPPPVNVPPPSVLLSAFPSLLSTGNSLFKPVSAQTSSIKERILSDPKAIEFLQGYILIATTAGHVIAGRKHRWHRDKILAKSMSISAAGSKGMKLAGVDKTQSKREDREAADVAMAWSEYVGRVRSAVAAANSSGKASLKVPEISENMQVQTAKMTPTAAKPCIICGLKREERVSKVDFDVEDSFGEWWVDHWGHRACKNFWQQHEQMLRQR